MGEGERLILVKTQEGAEGGPTGLPPEVASFVKETGTPVSDEGAWLPSAMTAWHGPSMQQSTFLSWRGAAKRYCVGRVCGRWWSSRWCCSMRT